MTDEQIKEIQTLLFSCGVRADLPTTEVIVAIYELYKEKGMKISFEDVERLKNTIHKKHNITPELQASKGGQNDG